MGKVVELTEAEIRVGGHLVAESANMVGNKGQVIAVRGPNGGGKTSVLKTLAGVLGVSQGERVGPASAAYVPAAIEPPVVKVKKWIALFPRENRTDIAISLEILSFHGNVNKPCTALSFGNLRKLMLAEAFSSGESLIVVDEWDAGLDAEGGDGLAKLARESAENGSCVVLAGQTSQASAVADETYIAQNLTLTKVEGALAMDEVHLAGPADKITAIRQYSRTLGVTEIIS